MPKKANDKPNMQKTTSNSDGMILQINMQNMPVTNLLPLARLFSFSPSSLLTKPPLL